MSRKVLLTVIIVLVVILAAGLVCIAFLGGMGGPGKETTGVPQQTPGQIQNQTDAPPKQTEAPKQTQAPEQTQAPQQTEAPKQTEDLQQTDAPQKPTDAPQKPTEVPQKPTQSSNINENVTPWG